METKDNGKDNGKVNGNGSDLAKVTAGVVSQALATAAHEVKDEAISRIGAAILDRIDATIEDTFAVPVLVTEDQIKAMHLQALSRTVQACWNARARERGYLPKAGKR